MVKILRNFLCAIPIHVLSQLYSNKAQSFHRQWCPQEKKSCLWLLHYKLQICLSGSMERYPLTIMNLEKITDFKVVKNLQRVYKDESSGIKENMLNLLILSSVSSNFSSFSYPDYKLIFQHDQSLSNVSSLCRRDSCFRGMLAFISIIFLGLNALKFHFST